jgi:hypothetical protein
MALRRRELEEFQPVAEWIVCVNAPEAGEARVPPDVLARSDQSVHHVVEIGDQNAGMTFAGRSEIVVDSEMQFDGTGAEPRSAARREGRWLIDLDHAEHAGEEISGALLLIPRHC